MGLYFGLLVISLVFGLIGAAVSARLKSVFKTYSREPFPTGMSGRDIAARMLHDHGITDVSIQSVPGKLTDHYNPRDKTVNLSPEVHDGRSVAAAAVAAHEVGHAVQHATAYAWLGMRSKLVPVVNVSSKLMRWVMMAALIGLFGFENPVMLFIALVLQGAIMAFALVTLPVEFDASKRAMVWLDETGMAGRGGPAYQGARTALKWAGMTYFVAALASVAQFLYLLALFLRRR